MRQELERQDSAAGFDENGGRDTGAEIPHGGPADAEDTGGFRPGPENQEITAQRAGEDDVNADGATPESHDSQAADAAAC